MADILEAVIQLTPRIRELEADFAEKRQLPTELVEEMKSAGVFRMAMPKSWGGPELPILDQLAILEQLAYANGSVGWCAMIGCDSGYYSAFLDDDVARQVWPSLDMVTAGLTAPGTNASKVDGGYRVSGRWRFGSGVTHADVIVGGALIVDESGAMQPGAAGLPMFRTLILPRDQVEILDTWYPTGLEGSGSHDYSVVDAFVPEEHAIDVMAPTKRDGPLYAHGFLTVISKVAATPLGIARRAIDELIALAPTKLGLPSMVLVRDEPRTHMALARAEALVSSARAFAWDAVGAVWDTTVAGDDPSPRQRAMVRLAMQHSAQSSRDAIALVYDTMTTSAVYLPNPIDQALRDTTTILQHIVLSTRNTEIAGRVLIGLPANAPFF